MTQFSRNHYLFNSKLLLLCGAWQHKLNIGPLLMCLYLTLDCVWDSSENMPMYCEYSFEVLAILNSFMQTDLIMQLLNSGRTPIFWDNWWMSCRHVPISTLSNLYTDYYNHKVWWSMLIQFLVDADYWFLDVYVCRMARKGIRCKRVLAYSALCNEIEYNQLHVHFVYQSNLCLWYPHPNVR